MTKATMRTAALNAERTVRGRLAFLRRRGDIAQGYRVSDWSGNARDAIATMDA